MQSLQYLLKPPLILSEPGLERR